MTRTLASLCLAVLALGPAGCLGDDPDHIPTTGITGGVSKGGGGRPITVPGTPVLRTGLTARLSVQYAGDAPDHVAAPELCGECTVTIDRSLLGDVVDLAVRDDGSGDVLCRVSATRGIVTEDSCGLLAAAVE